MRVPHAHGGRGTWVPACTQLAVHFPAHQVAMLQLEGESITVAVLDPRDPADDDKKGGRYCTGGYIFQVPAPEAGTALIVKFPQLRRPRARRSTRGSPPRLAAPPSPCCPPPRALALTY